MEDFASLMFYPPIKLRHFSFSVKFDYKLAVNANLNMDRKYGLNGCLQLKQISVPVNLSADRRQTLLFSSL